MKIGFIGTGLMGKPMASRLIQAGHEVFVWNRTREKVEPLAREGARVCDHPHEAIAQAEVTVTMLSDGPATRSALGFDGGTPPPVEGKTLIQMGTIGPDESKQLMQDTRALGGDYLESPVLGSTPEATEGKLILMVGATPEQYEQWKDVLTVFGPNPRLIGEVGAGATVKLAMNQLIAGLTITFSESLSLVQNGGVDVEAFMAITRESPLHAKAFDKKLPRMLDRDFAEPHFPVKHLLKDVKLFERVASQLGVSIETIKALESVLERAIEQGHADSDYSAAYSGVNPPKKE